MRFSSLFGPAAAEFASIILLCTASLPFTQGQSNTLVPSPNLDLGNLGSLAIAGDFDAISLYQYYGQTEGVAASNGSQSVLSILPNGAFDALSSSDASINAMCPFVLKDGTLAGVVVGGNFTSLGGVDASAIALFDPTTTKVTPLPGVFGTVSAILCDQDTSSVYVGGSFKAANSTNAIAWVGMTGWANLPFAGFNAPVTSITKAPSGHIVFGGSFSGLGNASIPTQGGKQVINLVTANLTSTATTTQAGFTNESNIVCPANQSSGAGNTWLLADNAPGSWRAELGFGFQPTRLRLWNTDQDGRGTKTFRFTAHPINGIMNLTYTDSTGKLVACDSTCPLAQNTSYQDFDFVNLVGMNGIEIDISAWYGDGGGLNGIELFQDDIFTYAVENFNEPSCSGVEFASNVTTTGPWAVTPSGLSVAEYLTASIGPSSLSSTSIVFQPDIRDAGNYSLIVYTPGCIQDNSCASRGVVNVTATLSSSAGQAFSTQIYQTNSYDKYDQVFLGKVDSCSSSFRPSVSLTPAIGPAEQHVVASRVRFQQITSTGGLNGLFDFDPNQAIVNTDFSQSAINNAGTDLHPNAIITALLTHNNTIYAAGDFSDDVYENIMAFANNNASSLPDNGLNAPVSAMYIQGDFLYVGGNFTGTSVSGPTGLNNVAAYQFSSNSWVPLGAGLNGAVSTIVPLQMNITQNQPETVVGISGAFTQMQAANGDQASPAAGFTIWVPSHSQWLQNLNASHQLLTGSLSTYVDVPNGPYLLAGTMASEGNAISGAASLTPNNNNLGLSNYPINIASSSSQSSSRKRALASEQNVTGVTSVSFYTSNSHNVTIFGGHFTATATNSSTIENMLFLNGSNNNVVTGLPEGLDSNSTFLALATSNNLLFAGGSLTGEASGSTVNGLVVYDLNAAQYMATQPPALQGNNVVVNAISSRPGTSDVYVAGSFDSAGSLPCAGVCMFSPSTGQWNAAGSDLGGSVNALYWSSNSQLIAAGDLTIGGSKTSLATYDPSKQNWTATTTTQLPGPVTAFGPAASDASQYWVAGTANNGSTFLVMIHGRDHRPVGDVFGSGTSIRSLQVLNLNQAHGSTPMLDSTQSLLVCGQLNLPNFGNASAALYNGTAFTPLILASSLSGQAGSIAGLFSSETNPLKSGGKLSYGLLLVASLTSI